MAVIQVVEQSAGRSGTIGMVADTQVKRTFFVTCNNIYDNPITINASPLLIARCGRFFSPHPSNPFYTRRNLGFSASSPRHWVVTAPYSTAPISQEERDKSDHPNPTDRPVRMSGAAQEYERYTQQDRNGDLRKNSAGDSFPPQPVEDSRAVLQLRANVTEINFSWFDLNETINDEDYTVTDGLTSFIIPAKRALIKGIGWGEIQEENGYRYYQISAELLKKKDEDGWKLSLLDEGFHYLDGSTRKKIMIEDGDGALKAPAESIPLDGSGAVLGVNAEPEFIKTDEKEEASWSILPFWT